IGCKGKSIFERYHLRLNQPFDNAVEVLHAVKFPINHCIKKRLAVDLARFDVFTCAWAGPQNLHRRNATTTISTRYQTLRNDVAKRLRKSCSDNRLFVLWIKSDDAVDSL